MREDAVSSTLKALLKKNGTTIAELSAATKIPAPTLYSMQSKRTNTANLDHLRRIAEFFHEDIHVFFGEEDYQKPIELSDRERVLLTLCRKMNDKGQQRVLDYAEDISVNRKYGA